MAFGIKNCSYRHCRLLKPIAPRKGPMFSLAFNPQCCPGSMRARPGKHIVQRQVVSCLAASANDG
jgi:hypothetical protein